MNRLKELREAAILTVHELSELSGVSEDTITKIENGHRAARPSTIRKLATALAIEPQELRRSKEPALSGKDEPPSRGLRRLPRWAETADLHALNQNVAEVPSEELRNLVIRLARALQWNPTLEDRRDEPRTESTARVLNLARIYAIAEELRRRGDESPEEYLIAFRQWQEAMTPPPEAEPQSGAGRGIPEAG